MVNYETTENSLFQYWLTGNQSMLHPCEIVQVIKFLITICSCCRSMVLNHCSWDKHCWNMFMHIGYKLWIKIVMWNLLVLLCIRGIYIYQKKNHRFPSVSFMLCLPRICLSFIHWNGKIDRVTALGVTVTCSVTTKQSPWQYIQFLSSLSTACILFVYSVVSMQRHKHTHL